MMDKLAARVVWSIKASRSTLEHARKIYANVSNWAIFAFVALTVMIVLLGT
jgi:hypothetical protein